MKTSMKLDLQAILGTVVFWIVLIVGWTMLDPGFWKVALVVIGPIMAIQAFPEIRKQLHESHQEDSLTEMKKLMASISK